MFVSVCLCEYCTHVGAGTHWGPRASELPDRCAGIWTLVLVIDHWVLCRAEPSSQHPTPLCVWDRVSYSTDSDLLILLLLCWMLKIEVCNTIQAVHETLEAFAKFVQEKMLSLGLAGNRPSQGDSGWWWWVARYTSSLCVLLLASCSGMIREADIQGPSTCFRGKEKWSTLHSV